MQGERGLTPPATKAGIVAAAAAAAARVVVVFMMAGGTRLSLQMCGHTAVTTQQQLEKWYEGKQIVCVCVCVCDRVLAWVRGGTRVLTVLLVLLARLVSSNRLLFVFDFCFGLCGGLKTAEEFGLRLKRSATEALQRGVLRWERETGKRERESVCVCAFFWVWCKP